MYLSKAKTFFFVLHCDDNKCALIKSVKLTDNYDCMSKKLSILFNISFAEKNGNKTETKTLETEGYIPQKTAFLNSDEIDIRNERDTDCRKYRKQNNVSKFFCSILSFLILTLL